MDYIEPIDFARHVPNHTLSAPSSPALLPRSTGGEGSQDCARGGAIELLSPLAPVLRGEGPGVRGRFGTEKGMSLIDCTLGHRFPDTERTNRLYAEAEKACNQAAEFTPVGRVGQNGEKLFL